MDEKEGFPGLEQLFFLRDGSSSARSTFTVKDYSLLAALIDQLRRPPPYPNTEQRRWFIQHGQCPHGL